MNRRRPGNRGVRAILVRKVSSGSAADQDDYRPVIDLVELLGRLRGTILEFEVVLNPSDKVILVHPLALGANPPLPGRQIENLISICPGL